MARINRWYLLAIASAILLLIFQTTDARALLRKAKPQAIIYAEFRGIDLEGGAWKHFGSKQHGRLNTNYVYAQSTGAASTMRARFELAQAPEKPAFLYLRALDDDFSTHCRIELKVNDTAIFRGPNEFSGKEWQDRRYPIPPGAIKAGANEIHINCIEKEGALGMPPWFCVALCAIAGEGYELRTPPRDLAKEFFVTLPKEKRSFPEPLPEGRSRPGFAIRMVKGWFWAPEQYLEVIPTLAKYKINFLMICPTSLFSHFPQWRNEWWLPIPEERKRKYEAVFRACKKHRIEVLFSIHPQLSSPRPIDPASDVDFEKLWQHYEWAQGQGLRWFNVQFDDVAASTAQFPLVNKLLTRLRAKDPQAQMVFCPTWYWGDGASPAEARSYNEQLGRELHPDIYLFWTGDGVVTPRITRRCLESYKEIVQHRVIIWDNYPVNDGSPTLHLGPVTGRDPDLCDLADGYMSNSMCQQNQIDMLPLLTMADYAWNPWDYDPERSIGQAILHLASNPEQRQVLKDLVEAYPGMLLYSAGTGFNPVRSQFERIVAAPHSRYIAENYIGYMKHLISRLHRAFPHRFGPEKKTLIRDLVWMEDAFEAKYGEQPGYATKQ